MGKGADAYMFLLKNRMPGTFFVSEMLFLFHSEGKRFVVISQLYKEKIKSKKNK